MPWLNWINDSNLSCWPCFCSEVFPVPGMKPFQPKATQIILSISYRSSNPTYSPIIESNLNNTTSQQFFFINHITLSPTHVWWNIMYRHVSPQCTRGRWRSSVSVPPCAPCPERVQEHHYGSSEDSFGLGFATRTCHVDVAERRQGGRVGVCWKEVLGSSSHWGRGRLVDPWEQTLNKVETWCTKHHHFNTDPT